MSAAIKIEKGRSVITGRELFTGQVYEDNGYVDNTTYVSESREEVVAKCRELYAFSKDPANDPEWVSVEAS